MQLLFPPPNAQAYDVPGDMFFDDGNMQSLPVEQSDMRLSDFKGRLAGVSGADTYEHYNVLWDFLIRNYWSELYDYKGFKTRNLELADRGYSTSTPTHDSFKSTGMSGMTQPVQNYFHLLIEDFEKDIETDANGATTITDGGFLGRVYGENMTPKTFYEIKNKDVRLRMWENYLRNTELGRRRWNIFLYTWEQLLVLMKTLQLVALNKAVAQRWMTTAQKRAIEVMERIDFHKQSSSQDFASQHINATLNHDLDILRIDRGNVQRMSSAKSQQSSSSLEKANETNTFIKTMIDQLEGALRGVLRT